MTAAGLGHPRGAASALLLRSWGLPTRELSALARLSHKKVADHYENPRNVWSLDKTSKSAGTGLGGASGCGDGKTVDTRCETFGCGSAIAFSLLTTEWVKGKMVEEALTIKNTDIAKDLCLPPVKMPCSMLWTLMVSVSVSTDTQCSLLARCLFFGLSFVSVFHILLAPPLANKPNKTREL
uniref:NIF system FeS cluster assembly NifU N-terminal domain-containing protein n=1 Tax=Equus asinus TaxID=9793 RepID=A0A9L0IZA0_EQUAS